ncbi:methylaspartate mutase subunit E [Thermodesulfobacteriota bacterium]
METRNMRLDDESFHRERKEVLAMWGTDKVVNLDEAIEFHRNLPPKKNFAKKLMDTKEMGKTLIRTDSGVPTLEEHCEYLKYLQEEGQSDGLGTIVDSLTRHLKFDAAERGLKESLKTGKWALNGFPLVAYGVEGSRKIIESVDLPVMIRGVAPDWRLIAEIGFAGGHTATSGGPLISFSQFNKDIPFEVVIKNYQYMFRLIGYYEERGAPIMSGFTGGFGILCPFSAVMAGTIIDSLIAAEQGVKNMCLTLHTQGNIIQDIAAIITTRKTVEEYLDRFGYKDVVVTMNCTSWSGKFPDDVFEASAIISIGVFAAVLAKGEIAHVKTIEEAKTIPRREANAASLRLGKTIIRMLKDQYFDFDRAVVDMECEIMEKETKSIVDKVLEVGEGDAVLGELRAVELGILDFPFASSRFIQCKIKGVRDNKGMVRYLDHGNMPFDNEIIDYNREKVKARGIAQDREVDFQSVIDDLSSISKGLLVSKP